MHHLRLRARYLPYRGIPADRENPPSACSCGDHSRKPKPTPAFLPSGASRSQEPPLAPDGPDPKPGPRADGRGAQQPAKPSHPTARAWHTGIRRDTEECGALGEGQEEISGRGVEEEQMEVANDQHGEAKRAP